MDIGKWNTTPVSLVIICLLLLIVSCVRCYFYYAKYQRKQSFHDLNIKLEKARY